MKSLAECLLYAFVDTGYLFGRKPETVARELCEGGADIIQLRAKDLQAREIAAMGREILRITEDHGVWLVINDHWSVACEIGAGLCHLGQEDFFGRGYKHISELIYSPVDEKGWGSTCGMARSTRPGVGLSTHGPEQALMAIRAGASYIAVGPVYLTATKPTAKPVTLEYVRWAARHCNVPWFAIGGITLANLDEVLSAGAMRVCVVSAILKAPDIRRACRAFKSRLMSRGGLQED